MKKIILCADDYGQNAAISEGILDLLNNGRLTAVSCMTHADDWKVHGEKLREFIGKVDIGLHFDLTQFVDQNAVSFSQLILKSCFNKLDLKKIEQDFISQLDAFEAILGVRPDYVDGHQHIHVFPGIRKIIIRVLMQRYGDQLPYLRQVNPRIFGHNSPIKAIILRVLSAGFVRFAKKNGFQFPSHFFGLYTLKPMQYSNLFTSWLQQAPAGSLIMCHPGLASKDPQDPIRAARIVEFEYLSSEKFLKDLHDSRAELCRWSSL